MHIRYAWVYPFELRLTGFRNIGTYRFAEKQATTQSSLQYIVYHIIKLLIVILLLLSSFIELRAQNLLIDSHNSNVLYYGMTTKITICGNGLNCEKLVLESSEMTISKLDDCTYVVSPLTKGNASILVGIQELPDSFIRLSEHFLVVKEFPLPKITVDMYNDGDSIDLVQLSRMHFTIKPVLDEGVNMTMNQLKCSVILLRNSKPIRIYSIDQTTIEADLVKSLFKTAKIGDALLMAEATVRINGFKIRCAPMELFIR